jgi:hypothetical protein
MPPARRRYEEWLSRYFANLSNWRFNWDDQQMTWVTTTP